MLIRTEAAFFILQKIYAWHRGQLIFFQLIIIEVVSISNQQSKNYGSSPDQAFVLYSLKYTSLLILKLFSLT